MTTHETALKRIRIRKAEADWPGHTTGHSGWWKAFCPVCNRVLLSVPCWPGPVGGAFAYVVNAANKHIKERH